MRPYFVKGSNRTDLIVDGLPFLMLGGELHNSSSSGLAYMEPIWENVKGLNLNTVLLSLSWELFEPEEGVFDYSLLDGLIEEARRNGLRLVILWFGTWKNASSSYVPEWVKVSPDRFVRAVMPDGTRTSAISCFSEECCKADARAFAAMMARIAEVDTYYTVLAVQVENEVGLLGAPRDYLPAANLCFNAAVPSELVDYLRANDERLAPDLKRHVSLADGTGNWTHVFGALAEEAFMAYYMAKYVGAVAQAGKDAYDLPMFVNAWTVQCKNEPAGMHPSGGPIALTHDIWRCAAPALDALAPDLYLECFEEECAAYTHLEDNPLIIPEARPDKWMMAHAFYAYAEHDALCFSPFMVEDIGNINPVSDDMVVQHVFQTMVGGENMVKLLRDTYYVLGRLSPIILQYRGTGKMQGILQNRFMNHVLEFGSYNANIRFNNFIDRAEVPAGGLAIELSENEFLLAGAGFSVQFLPKPDRPCAVEYLYMEEGIYEDGKWVRSRRLNGDELYLSFPSSTPVVRRYKLFSFF